MAFSSQNEDAALFSIQGSSPLLISFGVPTPAYFGWRPRLCRKVRAQEGAPFIARRADTIQWQVERPHQAEMAGDTWPCFGPKIQARTRIVCGSGNPTLLSPNNAPGWLGFQIEGLASHLAGVCAGRTAVAGPRRQRQASMHAWRRAFSGEGCRAAGPKIIIHSPLPRYAEVGGRAVKGQRRLRSGGRDRRACDRQTATTRR